MTKTTTLIYPFDLQAIPLLRHRAYPENLHIKKIVSPKGWGLVGKDAGTIDYGPALGIFVSGDFDTALAECETVFFVQPDFPLSRNIVLKNISKSISANKNIICIFSLSEEELFSLKSMAEARGVQFQYYNNNQEYKKLTSDYLDSLEIESKPINTPVVMFFGLLEGLGKFDAQLSFYKYISSLGYKASLITSRPYGQLFNAKSIPHFMYMRNLHEEEKIVLFNNYVKQIEKEEKPDLFIIGVPGGIIPLNKKMSNRHGISAYEITREIVPDVSILCTYFEKYTPEYIKKFNTLCKYRFSADISCYLINNTALDLNSRDTPDKVSTMPIEPEKTKKYIKGNFPIPLFTCLEKEKAFSFIMEKLYTFKEIEAF